MTYKPYVELSKAKRQCSKIITNGFNTFMEAALTNPKFKKVFENTHRPKVEWVKMGFNVAGRAWLSQNRIEMNINYLYSKDAQAFIEDTPLHELAHLLAFKFCQDTGHGKAWKAIARMLGDTGERCHDLADPDNKPKRNRVTCKCKCGEIHTVTLKKYNGFVNGDYICNHCKTNMKFATLIDFPDIKNIKNVG